MPHKLRSFQHFPKWRCNSLEPGSSKCQNCNPYCPIRSCLPLGVSELLRMRKKNSPVVKPTTAEAAKVRWSFANALSKIGPSKSSHNRKFVSAVLSICTASHFFSLTLPHTCNTFQRTSNVMYLHMAVNTHA